MFHVVLYRPEIPPNTGNAMRLSANTGVRLHLIEPLGFNMEDARLRRAGMDYRDRASVEVHPDLDSWRAAIDHHCVLAFAKQGDRPYADVSFHPGDALLFGPESVGLPPEVLAADWIDAILHIPMRPGVRSLNLSNAVAIAVFEAWRQNGFGGSEER